MASLRLQAAISAPRMLRDRENPLPNFKYSTSDEPAPNSARGDIPAGNAARGQHELPKLRAARAKRRHGRSQVETPHPPEAGIVTRRQRVPGRLDVVPPCLQGPVVIRPEPVPVLHYEQAFDRLGDLHRGRQHRIGEDVALDPWIGMAHGLVAADRVQQEQAAASRRIIDQATLRQFEVVAVVAQADMLEHPDREDAIETLIQLAVILQADFDGQAVAEAPGILRLLAGDGHADTTDAVMLRGVLQGFAPAAADVEHAHTGAQVELATDQVELRVLGGIEVHRVAPISTAVDHALAEHGLEERIADVVMTFAYHRRAPGALQVHHPGARVVEPGHQPGNAVVEPGT